MPALPAPSLQEQGVCLDMFGRWPRVIVIVILHEGDRLRGTARWRRLVPDLLD
jgi:hypothetical protein